MRIDWWNAYCETTKTCPWSVTHIRDKEQAVQLGRQHAIEDHPTKPEWRVRVKGVRVPTATEAAAMLKRH